MKLFILFLSTIFLFASCINKTKSEPEIDFSNFSDKPLFLKGMNANYEQKDTLCSVSLKIPVRLDTFYQWQDIIDYYDGGFTKYRFSDKRYVQYPESGFFYITQPDSVYQLTIWHKKRSELPDSLELKQVSEDKLANFANSVISITSMGEPISQVKAEYRLINGRPFFIGIHKASAGYLTWKPTLFVVGITNLKNRSIYFVGECCAQDTVGFVDKMYKSILSVRIKEK